MMKRQLRNLNLAIVGNCTVSALIDADATIVWCCVPRFDSDPVFHALLDSRDETAHEGAFTVELYGHAHSEQRYDEGTAVLRTRLYDAQGEGIEIVDFAPRFSDHGRMFRPAQLVRRVRPLGAAPRIRLRLRPRYDWGAEKPALTRGSNHLRYVMSDLVMRVTTNAPLTYVVAETMFTLRDPVSFFLGPDETLEGGHEETARRFEEETCRFWRQWTRSLAVPLEWQDAVIRSAITLKLCQYEDTGAIVAAMTTSVPEAANTERNWDYRYCWLRDAFFVVRALNGLSEVGTMEVYLRWLHNVAQNAAGGHIQPMFGIGLEKDLPERIVSHLPGYRGMGPVRVGNQACEHQQHDVYGNVVLGASQSFHDLRLFRRGDLLDFTVLEGVGERAWSLHDRPDAGMWELRTRARVHTSSALMCWAACDRLAKIARTLGVPSRESHWANRAREIRRRIVEESWCSRRGAFVESFGGENLDASVLLMAEVGFIDARDERFMSTVAALERHLCEGAFMRRYEEADDFGVPESAFTVCSFWRIDALARCGRITEARDHFEAILARRNPVGLLSEDVCLRTGELWGNFPQTYSMVGIINGAVRLSRPWDDLV
ncbi:MAG: glycoside hydrolase family 15 protein [Gammaproteobacteria bacterium]|nr:glycoside hydrolase family 15 protein [Gammaproteobacteria bacterium]